jgi:hypothetical protein
MLLVVVLNFDVHHLLRIRYSVYNRENLFIPQLMDLSIVMVLSTFEIIARHSLLVQ